MKPVAATIAHHSASFPAVTIASLTGGPPVEVNLIAQLGIGAGSPLVLGAANRQASHPAYIDALDEPSARLGGMDFQRGDRSSLYSFVVGAGGHPFHAHAGPRMFTAVSGSSGAQLRFSTLPLRDFENEPERFVRSLHLVDIPPDCLFTVRFGGGTWHQFVTAKPESGEPALFALSCHPDELAGITDEQQTSLIKNNQASIPLLTEVLPPMIQNQAAAALATPQMLRRTTLSLHGPGSDWRSLLCAAVRGPSGRLRGLLNRWRHTSGSKRFFVPGLQVVMNETPPADSLLWSHFNPARIDHDDTFECKVNDPAFQGRSASQILDALLENFVQRPPATITAMMMLRNALVLPLGLRRSRLGCPVSSLNSRRAPERFAGKHSVLAQAVDESGLRAEVLLGADDRHLRYRTGVAVQIRENGTVVFVLSSRVACRNRFGRFYMAVIRRAHQGLVSPTLLRTAIAGIMAADQTGLDETFERVNAY
jgi:hypothetical protein